MSTTAPRALRQAVEERRFEPVYHLTGENDFVKEETLAQLLAAAVDPKTRDFNLEIRRAGDLDAELLASLLATPPMMADRRVIVIREPAALRKDARAELDRYCRRPQSDVVLVVVSPAGAKSDNSLEKVATVVEFPPLSDNHVPRWIEDQVQRAGGSITSEAATLLFEVVGNDLPQLAMELRKLSSYARGATIDAEAVAAAVGVRRGETLADLLDRIAERDAAGAVGLLPVVLSQPRNNAVFIVMALAAQTLALAWARAQQDAGVRGLEGALFGFLKESPSSPIGRPWGEAVRTWSRNVSRWTALELDDALGALLAADRALKESRISSEQAILESLVLTLCAREAAAAPGRAA